MRRSFALWRYGPLGNDEDADRLGMVLGCGCARAKGLSYDFSGHGPEFRAAEVGHLVESRDGNFNTHQCRETAHHALSLAQRLIVNNAEVKALIICRSVCDLEFLFGDLVPTVFIVLMRHPKYPATTIGRLISVNSGSMHQSPTYPAAPSDEKNICRDESD